MVHGDVTTQLVNLLANARLESERKMLDQQDAISRLKIRGNSSEHQGSRKGGYEQSLAGWPTEDSVANVGSKLRRQFTVGLEHVCRVATEGQEPPEALLSCIGECQLFPLKVAKPARVRDRSKDLLDCLGDD